ncbi:MULTISPECIES: acyltransferase domain-containing protein [Methylorubrum]|uniref:Acyl transferase domain protein n=2 Tax=Methylorubrum extorquens TaxID=408 RepID=H1KUR2_METEX|nr:MULTISPECIES: acyltransferase domain-containing protein [Methylorubrum]ACS38002.1 Acyl transferase domain protein, putative malonyl CoA-acyl carrier protein transacylase (MCT, fabD-like) [Methylorubrum extorquens AM1]EHP80240.1 acyl transferase domain protein [Methylorubrum extorquens DSM 13060]MCP1543957.1 [acyl-carrier-protein] S-malonyltransferase [Methylorubrum extorquens]MCP1588697.1 [acyl-carrier-protein] S-malonyltransferase [Methylorubrum extorquens]BDL37439.1 malonate decarboxylase
MTLAVLLSGQGGQHPGMFDLTAEWPAAAPVFAAAECVLGQDPRALVRIPGADLHGNRTGQILCCVAALAGWTLVQAAHPARTIVAGYSIGDLAAWGCAGRFDAETILRLAATRAEAMDAAAGDGASLAGIRGLPIAAIETLAAAQGCELAIRNASDSAVIGGPSPALEALCVEALAAGALRAVVLPVRTPSHTPLLREASQRFEAALAGLQPLRPPPGAPRLISGLDGAPVFDVRAGLSKLARQISHTIDWAACLDACREYGCDTVLELGPGHALATMARNAIPEARVHALDEFRSASGVTEWIGGR